MPNQIAEQAEASRNTNETAGANANFANTFRGAALAGQIVFTNANDTHHCEIT